MTDSTKKPSRKLELDGEPQLRLFKAIIQLTRDRLYPTSQRITALVNKRIIKRPITTVNSHLTYMVSQGYLEKEPLTGYERSKGGVKKCIWKYSLAKKGQQRYRYLLKAFPKVTLNEVSSEKKELIEKIKQSQRAGLEPELIHLPQQECCLNPDEQTGRKEMLKLDKALGIK